MQTLTSKHWQCIIYLWYYDLYLDDFILNFLPFLASRRSASTDRDSRFFFAAIRQINCTWLLVLFVEPALFIFPHDHFTHSTSVCFHVIRVLFYSFERIRLFTIPIYTLFLPFFLQPKIWQIKFIKNDYISDFNVYKYKKKFNAVKKRNKRRYLSKH